MQGRTGLTSATAASRLAADGPNELPAARGRRLFDVVLHVFAEPMFLLMCTAVGLYLLLGELREALILATSLLAVVVISASQERRAGRALEALRDLSSPRAAVLRDARIAAHRGARGRAGRHRDARRGRPRAGRRRAARIHRPRDRRVPADRRVAARAKTCAAAGRRHRSGAGRGPHVFRNPGHPRPRHRRSHRDRRAQRTGQDRPGARDAEAAADAAVPRDPAHGAVARRDRHRSLHRGDPALRRVARRTGSRAR